MRYTTLSLLACSLLAGVAFAEDSQSTAATPESKPDATFDLRAGSVAAGVGYVWGKGTLTYMGAKHAFRISGVSIVDAGATHLDARGSVYNLGNLDDFNGSYTAVATGVTIAGGGTAAVLRNEHGVVVKLVSKAAGLRLSLSAEKVFVKLTS